MACGLPIIASLLPGITTDLVEHGREGFLIQGFDPMPYADAILELLSDDQKMQEMSQAAVARIKEDFELHVIAEKYQSLFDSIDY